MKNVLYNPYINTSVVRDQDMFFGRRTLLRRIYGELASRQSISLIGLRHSGKSSLLQVLPLADFQGEYAERLRKHIFVPLDLREYRQKSSDDFFEAVSKHILAQARKHLDLDSEVGGADEFIALLTEIHERGFHVVLLMDAFDNVARNSRFDMEFFSLLRSQARRVSYVTATFAPLEKVCHSSVEESPFFNIFLVHRVGVLTHEEARQLVLFPSQSAGLPFTDDEADWVLRMAGFYPFFIQQVCNFFYEEKLSQDDAEVNRKHIKSVAYRALEPHFADAWDHLSQEEQEQLKVEASIKNMDQREVPELSESSLFRIFVRDKFKLHLFHMSTETLEEALDKLGDPRELGDCEFANIVSSHDQQSSQTSVEKGLQVRKVLNEALERMRGSGIRQDSAQDWHLYNILYYRYFKHHLKNDQIAARLELSTRKYFRERTKAIETLFNTLLEMESTHLNRDED